MNHHQPLLAMINHALWILTIMNNLQPSLIIKKIYPSTYHISYAYIFLASFTIHHNTHPSHSIKINHQQQDAEKDG
jgi:hypothetical protein